VAIVAISIIADVSDPNTTGAGFAEVIKKMKDLDPGTRVYQAVMSTVKGEGETISLEE
jgi:hypothetical protein